MSWGVVYCRTRAGTVPAHEFLLGCPTAVRAKLLAVLEVVRAAPPPAFSGGGKWEAMHGKMSGYYEIRCTGPGRRHYRLYCILDNGTSKELAERGFQSPQIAGSPSSIACCASTSRLSELDGDSCQVCASSRR